MRVLWLGETAQPVSDEILQAWFGFINKNISYDLRVQNMGATALLDEGSYGYWFKTRTLEKFEQHLAESYEKGEVTIYFLEDIMNFNPFYRRRKLP